MTSPVDPNAGRTAARVRAAERLAALDELEVSVEKLVAGGDGLARFEGIPIFVPRSAPGDRLRVRLVERKPDYARAEIVALLAPGRARREPPCPHFGRCGGCDLQHLEDAEQSRLKVVATMETLARLGGVDPSQSFELLKGDAWGYRLRTRLRCAPTAAGTAVGYFGRGSHELVAVQVCPVLAPELERLLPGLPDELGGEAPRRIDLAVGDNGAVSGAPRVDGLPRGELELTVGDIAYSFDARCFFQTHRGLLPRLVDCVVGEWEGESAFDLYGGVGLFGVPLARRYAAVTVVEGDRVAARFAQRNARRARGPGWRGGVEVVHRAVESWIEGLPHGADRVVVDPPRAGLATTVRRRLLERAPRRLTYVSCHPGALARDLRELRPIYRIDRLTLLDMFPQTGHMEVVVQLRADGSPPVRRSADRRAGPRPRPTRESGRTPSSSR